MVLIENGLLAMPIFFDRIADNRHPAVQENVFLNREDRCSNRFQKLKGTSIMAKIEAFTSFHINRPGKGDRPKSPIHPPKARPQEKPTSPPGPPDEDMEEVEVHVEEDQEEEPATHDPEADHVSIPSQSEQGMDNEDDYEGKPWLEDYLDGFASDDSMCGPYPDEYDVEEILGNDVSRVDGVEYVLLPTPHKVTDQNEERPEFVYWVMANSEGDPPKFYVGPFASLDICKSDEGDYHRFLNWLCHRITEKDFASVKISFLTVCPDEDNVIRYLYLRHARWTKGRVQVKKKE